MNISEYYIYIYRESDLYWTSIYIGPRRFHSFTTIQQLVAPNRVLAAKKVIDWLIQSGGMRAQKKRCGFLYLSCCCCNCIAISSVCLSVSIDPASVGFACRVFEAVRYRFRRLCKGKL